jgi:hypothetical protein
VRRAKDASFLAISLAAAEKTRLDRKSPKAAKHSLIRDERAKRHESKSILALIPPPSLQSKAVSRLPMQVPWRDFVRVLRHLGYATQKGKAGSARHFSIPRETRIPFHSRNRTPETI